jgi:hypothetical protein
MFRMALLAGLLLATAATSTASSAHGYYDRPYWGGGYYGPRVGVYFGSPWYWGTPWSPWAWGGPWVGYAQPYAYGHPAWRYPPFEQGEAPGPYIERAPTAGPGGSWYYCSDPPGYYPHVPVCARPWIAVAPFPVQGDAARPRTSR